MAAAKGKGPVISSIQEVPAEAGVDAIVKIITRLYNTNDELIQCIDKARDLEVSSYQYSSPPIVSDDGTECKFALETTQSTVAASELIDGWKKRIELLDIFDLFNFKIDYTCDRFADVKRLNEAMFAVTTHCNAVFDDNSKKGKDYVLKILENFIALHAAVQDVHALCKDQPCLSDSIQAILGQANKLLLQAMGVGNRYACTAPLPSLPVPFKKHISPEAMKALRGWIPPPVKGFVFKYAGSVHGFSAADFHAKCDGVPRLLVLVITTQGYAFGGFAGVSFQLNGAYTTDADAFLFSIGGPDGPKAMKFPVSNPSQALYCQYNYGPTWGTGHDLVIVDNCNSNSGSYICLGSAYTNPTGNSAILNDTAGRGRFQVADIVAYHCQ